MKKSSTIFVSDKNSLIGKSVISLLIKEGFQKIITPDKNINLNSFEQVDNFFNKNKPSYVVICSSKSGGIIENLKFPVDLMEENLISQYNLIKSSYNFKVKKLMFIGSSCVYPKNLNIAAKEKDLLSGKLEDFSQSYSVANISGMELCRAYRIQFSANFFSVIPTNIYGPGEDYNKRNMHVIPSLIKKIHYAKINQIKSVKLIGDGKPIREFLYSNDFAHACLALLKNNKKFKLINVGSGQILNIKSLANKIKMIVNYKGKILFTVNKYNGTNIKKLNFNEIKKIGWKPKTKFEEGLKSTYFDYLNQI